MYSQIACFALAMLPQVCQPKTLESKSGQHSLRVEPLDRKGGEATICTALFQGAEVWRTPVPFGVNGGLLDDSGAALLHGVSENGAERMFHVTVLDHEGRIAKYAKSFMRRAEVGRRRLILLGGSAVGVRFSRDDQEVWRIYDLSRPAMEPLDYSPSRFVEGEYLSGPVDVVSLSKVGVVAAYWIARGEDNGAISIHDAETFELLALRRNVLCQERGRDEVAVEARVHLSISNDGCGVRLSDEGGRVRDVGIQKAGDQQILLKLGSCRWMPSGSGGGKPDGELAELDLLRAATLMLPASVKHDTLGIHAATTSDDRVILNSWDTGDVWFFGLDGQVARHVSVQPRALWGEPQVRIGGYVIYASSGFGPRYALLDAESGEISTVSMVGYQCSFSQNSGYSWCIEDGAIRQFDSSGECVALIRRRPDRKWFRGPQAVAASPEGGCAVLDDGSLSLYSPQSDALGVIDVGHHDNVRTVRYDGQFVAISDRETYVVIANAGSGDVRAYSLESDGSGGVFSFGLNGGGVLSVINCVRAEVLWYDL